MLVSKRTVALIAIGVFLFALILRAVGLGWGLRNDLHDYSYHPDEQVIVEFSQQIKPAEGKFTPGFYNYGTLYLTTLRVASDVVSAYTGAPDPRDPASRAAWLSRVHVAGRIISALAGAGIAVLGFLIVYRFVGLFGAIFSGLTLAVAPALVMHSRFQTVDVPAAFWLALGAYAAFRLIPGRDQDEVIKFPERWAILSGVAFGLSAGTKYTGILGLVTLAVVLGMVRPPNAGKLFTFGTLASIVAFLITTPGIVRDSQKFMQDFFYEITHTSTGHGLVFTDTPSGFVMQFGHLLVGFGFLTVFIGLGGLLYAAGRHRLAWAVGLLAFGLLYYVLIGRAEVKFLRYTFPLYLPIAVGFGYAVELMHRKAGYWRIGVAMAIAALGGLDTGGFRSALIFTAWQLGPDPRDQVVQYLRSQPTATVGLVSDPWFYTAPTFPTANVWRAVPLETRLELMRQTSNPPTMFRVDPGSDPYAFNLGLLTEDRPDRVVVSSFEFGDALRLRDANGLTDSEKIQVDRAKLFWERLNADYELERTFGDDSLPVHDLMYPRPFMQVWKRLAPQP